MALPQNPFLNLLQQNFTAKNGKDYSNVYYA